MNKLRYLLGAVFFMLALSACQNYTMRSSLDRDYLLASADNSVNKNKMSSREISTSRSYVSHDTDLKWHKKKLCNSHEYFCIRAKRGDTWRSLFPDNDKRDLVRRINRTNLPLRRGRVIVIPRNLERVSHRNEHAPFPSDINYSNDNKNYKRIVIDVSAQAYAAYDSNGYLLRWGPVSTGTSSHPTVKGTFRIFRKQGRGCISSKYPKPHGGASMPYCMHFYKGYAIHGKEMPGYPASHGCVRIFNDDARWLNQSFAKIGTKVIVQH